MYSPGAEPPALPEGRISPARTPPLTGALAVSFAALSFAAAESLVAAAPVLGLALSAPALFAVSPPRSCSTADGRPGAASPLMPMLRSTRSIAGMAFSSALVSSVMRNSRNALRCTMALARAGSSMPGSSTTSRSSPTF